MSEEELLTGLAISIRNSGRVNATFVIRDFIYMGRSFPAIFVSVNNDNFFDCVMILLNNHLCVSAAHVIEMGMDLYVWHGILPGFSFELCNPDSFDIDEIIYVVNRCLGMKKRFIRD
jgi:hypothetical protein